MRPSLRLRLVALVLVPSLALSQAEGLAALNNPLSPTWERGLFAEEAVSAPGLQFPEGSYYRVESAALEKDIAAQQFPSAALAATGNNFRSHRLAVQDKLSQQLGPHFSIDVMPGVKDESDLDAGLMTHWTSFISKAQLSSEGLKRIIISAWHDDNFYILIDGQHFRIMDNSYAGGEGIYVPTKQWIILNAQSDQPPRLVAYHEFGEALFYQTNLFPALSLPLKERVVDLLTWKILRTIDAEEAAAYEREMLPITRHDVDETQERMAVQDSDFILERIGLKDTRVETLPEPPATERHAQSRELKLEDIVVRPATPKDGPGVVALRHPAPGKLDLDRRFESWFDSTLEPDSDAFVFVAEHKGNIVGIMACQKSETETVEMGEELVSPDLTDQRQEIGNELLRPILVEVKARWPEMKTAEAFTERDGQMAGNIFLKMGFAEDAGYRGNVVDRRRYVLNLTAASTPAPDTSGDKSRLAFLEALFGQFGESTEKEIVIPGSSQKVGMRITRLQGSRKLKELIRKMIGRDHRGKSLLAIGVGAGSTEIGLAKRWGLRVTALDATMAMARRAKKKGLTAAVADAYRLPFADACFDIVTMIESFGFMGDPDRAVIEAARVLRSGGIFHIVADVLDIVLIGYRGYTATQLVPILARHGFERLTEVLGIDDYTYIQAKKPAPDALRKGA